MRALLVNRERLKEILVLDASDTPDKVKGEAKAIQDILDMTFEDLEETLHGK